MQVPSSQTRTGRRHGTPRGARDTAPEGTRVLAVDRQNMTLSRLYIDSQTATTITTAERERSRSSRKMKSGTERRRRGRRGLEKQKEEERRRGLEEKESEE
ncbi:hypothetical protein E2C01_052045 [Portunus trituberculatus]|uniref:Uncharacterized protein n=1 Tax=Portunus trituberculatus TaxID=210409 RepID=A0A5B7GGI9_PORTR|nr:hypothetical protein [Portunus trituberculatus]